MELWYLKWGQNLTEKRSKIVLNCKDTSCKIHWKNVVNWWKSWKFSGAKKSCLEFWWARLDSCLEFKSRDHLKLEQKLLPLWYVHRVPVEWKLGTRTCHTKSSFASNELAARVDSVDLFAETRTRTEKHQIGLLLKLTQIEKNLEIFTSGWVQNKCLVSSRCRSFMCSPNSLRLLQKTKGTIKLKLKSCFWGESKKMHCTITY